jgi:hypothetical protein
MNEEALLKQDQNEALWNKDIINAISSELLQEFPKVVIIKGKVLKDIFLKKKENSEYQLQFGFVDQDIIIYDETMDISEFRNVKNISLHNNKQNHSVLVIPKVIIELKYNGINSHGLVLYSHYAADIKSIFPKCKYFLMLRYRKTSSENKLFRHGKFFDKILYLSENKARKQSYKEGQFSNELRQDFQLNERFKELISEIKFVLQNKKSYFVK